MGVIIEIKNLCKTYKIGNVSTDVLKEINLEIQEGEFVSIMGPSGSGKSTILHLIGGLDEPTAGTIVINGKNLSAMTDKERSIMRRKNIGFVFQFYNLIPNLNVEENIMLPILLDGKSAKEYKKRLDEVIESVGLSERRLHTPAQLSGGQQQRVAIARALIIDPDIILADEPIGNLDSQTGIEIMELLRTINIKKGKTIIQVTHSKEASEYGQRVIYVKDGKVCL